MTAPSPRSLWSKFILSDMKKGKNLAGDWDAKAIDYLDFSGE